MLLKIKTLRKEQGMSQRAVAERIGCSQKSVDCWEKGLSEPTAGFICALADCFLCSTDFLLGREDDCGNVNVVYPARAGEQQLLLDYASLSEENKKALLSFAAFLRTR